MSFLYFFLLFCFNYVYVCVFLMMCNVGDYARNGFLERVLVVGGAS